MTRLPLPAALMPLATGLIAGFSSIGMGAWLVNPAAASMFQAAELQQERFVLVAAPIGDGTRAQLNIYEQLNGKRACYAVNGSAPAAVDPLLGSFDFTGICSRYIDANGYSVRVGGSDLAATYRLMVVRQNNDNLLMAIPTKAGAGPEMLVARTQGAGTGFLQLVFEPGWQLKRRAYGGRNLGHVYLYREAWPGADQEVGQQPVGGPVQAAN
jgi:hypothetical protein